MQLVPLDLGDPNAIWINEKGETLCRDKDPYTYRLMPSRSDAINFLVRAGFWSDVIFFVALMLGLLAFSAGFSFLISSGLVIVFYMLGSPLLDFLRKPFQHMEKRTINPKKSFQQLWKESLNRTSAGFLLSALFVFLLCTASLLTPLMNTGNDIIITVISASPFIYLTGATLVFFARRQKKKPVPLSKTETAEIELRLAVTKNYSAFFTSLWIVFLAIGLVASWFTFISTINRYIVSWHELDPEIYPEKTPLALSAPYLDKELMVLLIIAVLLFVLYLMARRLWITCGKPVTLYTEKYPFDTSWRALSGGLWFSLCVAALTFIGGYALFAYRDDMPAYLLERLMSL